MVINYLNNINHGGMPAKRHAEGAMSFSLIQDSSKFSQAIIEADR